MATLAYPDQGDKHHLIGEMRLTTWTGANLLYTRITDRYIIREAED
jgi:hypothetical protein